MIGSEHLSHMLSTDTTGGRVVGEELTSALQAAHDELGVSHVRAHAILGDDLGVYREVDGEPVHDFAGVDRVYDHLRSIGMYPVVELSFMPHDLASDPSKTVFEYGAIVSPPKDWQRWHDLIAATWWPHLADRYGLEDLVEHWSFEVWNEANLEVFWSGTPEEYLQLYDVTAAAVRSVDDRLRVGGPSSAASGWVEELLAHAERAGSPVDFVSTHTYGSPPLDFVPMLERYGREGTPIWWTEWGVTPTHFNEVSDAVFAGTFLLRGMASAMGQAVSQDRVAVLLGGLRPLRGARAPAGAAARRLRHPHRGRAAQAALVGARAARAAARDPPRRSRSTGDGAGSLVEALSSRSPSGEIGVLVWNLTLDQTKASGFGRPGPTGDRRDRRPRAGGVVRRPPRPRRRRPLRHRCGVGPAQGRRAGLADRRAVGPAARSRQARGARSRRDAGGGRRGSAWSLPSTCRCHRCRASPSPRTRRSHLGRTTS